MGNPSCEIIRFHLLVKRKSRWARVKPIFVCSNSIQEKTCAKISHLWSKLIICVFLTIIHEKSCLLPQKKSLIHFTSKNYPSKSAITAESRTRDLVMTALFHATKQGNDPVFWLNHLFNFGFLAVYMCPRIVRFIDKE